MHRNEKSDSQRWSKFEFNAKPSQVVGVLLKLQGRQQHMVSAIRLYILFFCLIKFNKTWLALVQSCTFVAKGNSRILEDTKIILNYAKLYFGNNM